MLFWATAPGFATLYNLTETLRDLSILGVIAIGETFVLIGGGIDLSVGSVLLIAGISVDDLDPSRWHERGSSPSPIAIAVGAVAGFLNGMSVTRLRISAFIVTFSTLYIFRGVGSVALPFDVHDLQGALIDDDNFLFLGARETYLAFRVRFIIFRVASLSRPSSFAGRVSAFTFTRGGNELAARLTRIRVANAYN